MNDVHLYDGLVAPPHVPQALEPLHRDLGPVVEAEPPAPRAPVVALAVGAAQHGEEALLAVDPQQALLGHAGAVDGALVQVAVGVLGQLRGARGGGKGGGSVFDVLVMGRGECAFPPHVAALLSYRHALVEAEHGEDEYYKSRKEWFNAVK